MQQWDAVVVGSGPNGLAAAIVLAQRGIKTLLLEAEETIGGGTRTAELTLPGFRHDVCSAVHPMAQVSPFFRTLPLADHGLGWAHAPFAFAHPLDDGTAAALAISIEATAARLGADGAAYERLMRPLASHAYDLFAEVFRPVVHLPRHPFLLARFGLSGIQSALHLVKRFRGAAARALFAGCAAHSILPLEWRGSAAAALMMMLPGHVDGWPVAIGGSSAISVALASYFRSLGGEIRTSVRVGSIGDVPKCRAIVFDVTPRQLAAIAGDVLPRGYTRRLQRFRYGPGVFKIDWALDGPIPWTATECREAATVHAGGTFEEMAVHERAVWEKRVTDRPFVLVAQQSLFDGTRAPAGKHAGWGYCHVPNGSTDDMTEAIERQIERFAPGFRDRILARHTMNTRQLEAHNANAIGGDIAGGANTLLQLIARPFLSMNPYATPNERIYIGSSSTPPGGGVHGMCGYWAAMAALKRTFKV